MPDSVQGCEGRIGADFTSEILLCFISECDTEEMRRRMQSPGGKGVPFPGAWGWFGVACTERGSKLRVSKCLGSHAKEPGLYPRRHRAPPKEVRPPTQMCMLSPQRHLSPLNGTRFVCFSQFPYKTVSFLRAGSWLYSFSYLLHSAHSLAGIEAQHLVLPTWWLFFLAGVRKPILAEASWVTGGSFWGYRWDIGLKCLKWPTANLGGSRESGGRVKSSGFVNRWVNYNLQGEKGFVLSSLALVWDGLHCPRRKGSSSLEMPLIAYKQNIQNLPLTFLLILEMAKWESHFYTLWKHWFSVFLGILEWNWQVIQ